MKKGAKRRLWPWLLVVVVALVLSAGAALYLLLPGIIMKFVEREARAVGVELRNCSLEYSPSRLTLTECSFELLDAPFITGTLGRIDVAIVDWKPASLRVERAAVEVRGLPDSPADELRRLDARNLFGEKSRLPIRVVDSQLLVFPAGDGPGAAPYLSLSKLDFDSATEALEAELLVDGLIKGRLSSKNTLSELEGALVHSPDTRFRLSVESQSDAADFRLEVEQLPLALFKVPGVINVPEELQAVQVSARVNSKVPFTLDNTGVYGELQATLSGVVLPIPREVQGLVYGPDVGLSSKFRVHPNHQRVDFDSIAVTAGALKLRGSAGLQVKDLRLLLKGSLLGTLSCGAILESATHAHTDSPLAREAAKLARKFVQGGVDVIVAFDGDLTQLDKFKVLRTIGIGCGLKPLPLPEDLAGFSKEVLKKLPPLPPLPELPRLPEPPRFTPPEPPKIKLPELPRLRRGLQPEETGPQTAPQE